MIQQYFNSRAIISYRPLQEYEVRKLLEDLRIDPQAYRRHVKRFIASVILTAAYGYQVASADDPFIELVERVTKMVLGPGLPGSSLVDYFPFCKELLLFGGKSVDGPYSAVHSFVSSRRSFSTPRNIGSPCPRRHVGSVLQVCRGTSGKWIS